MRFGHPEGEANISSISGNLWKLSTHNCSDIFPFFHRIKNAYKSGRLPGINTRELYTAQREFVQFVKWGKKSRPHFVTF